MQIVFRSRTALDDAAREDGGRSNHPAAEAAVRRWQDLFGGAKRTEDFEDFHENAAQLFSALDTDLPTYVLAPRSRTVSYTFNTTEAFDPSKPFVIIGSQGVRDPFHEMPGCCWPRQSDARAAEKAYLLPSFEHFAGRRAIPATYAPDVPENGPELGAAVADAIRGALAKGRPAAAFVKVVRQQKHSVPVEIEADPDDRAAISKAIHEGFEYTLMEFEGRAHAFLAQERMEMRREYRCILVGGKVIAGAGCLEPMTPLDNAGTRFDGAMEGIRNDGDLITDDALALSYAAKAEEIAAAFAAENPDFRSGTIDLCLDETGSIRLIEVNPALNFGLYAADYRHILAAILDEAATQGPSPARSPIEPGAPAFPFDEPAIAHEDETVEFLKLDLGE